MQIDVRPGRPDDWETYAALYHGEGPRVTLEQWREEFAEIERGERVALVAEMDGEMVGGAHLLFDCDDTEEATVAHVVVREDKRGLGIGRMLMDAIEALAVARGVRKVRLFVRPDNEPAVHLYETRGYEVVGREACEVKYPSCLIMRKGLAVR